MTYADVIINISTKQLDRTFQYSVPEELEGKIAPGMQVRVPFGSRSVTGWVLSVGTEPKIGPEQIRALEGAPEKAVTIETELIRLADYLRRTYGCTMNQALKTVLPQKTKVRQGKVRVEQTPLPQERELPAVLNDEQQAAADGIYAAFPKPALLFGITGSGKTEVYMDLIERTLAAGKEAILLIPEISLTYQNLRRFCGRFGDRVGIVNSRLSAGERSAVFEKARQGEIGIMIGPRSALFTPFKHLGLILIDEEHDSAYHSDTVPRYDAVDVALERGRLSGAGVVLGSATPALRDYYRAQRGELGLFRLTRRARAGSMLPDVRIVDLREELREGNRSIFSRELYAGIADRLARKEQVMLFLNRRGYAGFVSCRSCGHVMKCPHCDVSLKAHRGGRLACHYCGFETAMPDRCPVCGSPYIAGFGLGTQKVESALKQLFPEARVLRMDTDSTSGKAGHSRILSAFADRSADILIGTQMIVKGHDFPDVTLVGILAADLSLYNSEFTAAERTFQLLTQAAGRAGRADRRGLVVIQTYDPDNEAIVSAAAQDYERFYRHEMLYRSLLDYPPAGAMLSLLVTGAEEEKTAAETERMAKMIEARYNDRGIRLIGPAAAGVSKIKDRYRRVLYVKHASRDLLSEIREAVQAECREQVQADLM